MKKLIRTESSGCWRVSIRFGTTLSAAIAAAASIIALFALGACNTARKTSVEGASFEWPQNRKAAVSLTFDDGISVQAEIAAPLLKKYGLKGTFFLSGEEWAESEIVGEWKTAFADGNEIGSHTIHHPCPKEKELEYKSENYTPAIMQMELKKQIAFFKNHGMYKGETVFAYPCGVTWVGNDKQSYAPAVSQLFAAARGYTDDFKKPLNDPRTINLYEVQAANLEGKDATYLVGMVKEAEKTGQWLVFAFHGIGGGWLITETKEFEGLLKYLNANRETVWTAPSGEVAEYVRKNRQHETSGPHQLVPILMTRSDRSSMRRAGRGNE
jgi:peptidoglycan-N-acetylglucosamine deacetylase